MDGELLLISAYAALVAPFAEAKATLAIRLPDWVNKDIAASAALPNKAFLAKWRIVNPMNIMSPVIPVLIDGVVVSLRLLFEATGTYVRHEVDKPVWQREEVWIMGSGFDPARWEEEKFCQKHRLVAGTFDTLRKFGTKESKGDALGAKYALVYMDSPLLHACTLIDVPGYSDSNDEERSADSAAKLADLLIYTAPASGFLDAADFLHLGSLLRTLPTIHARSSRKTEKYANLFLVATHADPSIADSDLDRILERGTERLYRQFKETLFGSRDISQSELRDRFKTFWFESPARRSELEQGLRRTLSTVLPAALEKQVNNEVREIRTKAKSALSAQIEAYERTMASIDAARRNLVTLRQEEPQHRRRIREKREEVKAFITSLNKESTAFVHSTIASMLTAPAIEQKIRENFTDKDLAKQDSCAQLLRCNSARRWQHL
jgi:hypothetical protein